MATTSPRKPSDNHDLAHEPLAKQNFAAILRPPPITKIPIPRKPVTYLHGEPRVIWEEEEVEQMIQNKNLQYAVIGKFSYGWPDIKDLRRLIPKQCELKGECNIGLLNNKHVLIRTSNLEDYVSLLSKPSFYIAHRSWTYLMRTLKWEPLFDPEEEITTTIVWILFPSLPPNFFGKEDIFSLAVAVGKPLQVDLTMRNQIGPSCARVKVEVDLLGNFSKRINVGVRMQSGEITEKWIRIKYDHVPKYCKNCKIQQGHDDHQCYIIHPELYPSKKEKKKIEYEKSDKVKDDTTKNGETEKIYGEDQFKEQITKRGGKEKYQGWKKP